MTGKDVTIPQLVLQLDLLRSQVFSLEQTNSELQHEIQRLREENQRLQDQIARLQRNSSKSPSSDIVKPKNKGTSRRKGKRKIGGQKGHPRQERIPFSAEDIDATHFHVLPAEQVQDLTPLDDWFILQQVDLVEKLYRVTEHRARKYLDPRTGRIVIAPLPPAVKAAGLVGPKLSALAAYQKGDCHMSYSTIQRFWDEVLGLPISCGQLANVVQKVSAAFETPYDELREALVEQPYLGVDESGHKDSGDKLWTWCFRAKKDAQVLRKDAPRFSGSPDWFSAASEISKKGWRIVRDKKKRQARAWGSNRAARGRPGGAERVRGEKLNDKRRKKSRAPTDCDFAQCCLPAAERGL